jgi:hypothetical protein
MKRCVDRWTAAFPPHSSAAALQAFELAVRQKREQLIQAASPDMLARQRVLSELLRYIIGVRQGVSGRPAADRRNGGGAMRAVRRDRSPGRRWRQLLQRTCCRG